jgi:hypothetical protein
MAAEQDKSAAVSGAREWLSLVDSGKYSESWDEAAGYFQGSIGKNKWVQMLTSVRSPLGRNISRKLAKSTLKKELPGAPDGNYVICQFNSQFEKKKSAKETVTMMLGQDGTWRMAGYFIK